MSFSILNSLWRSRSQSQVPFEQTKNLNEQMARLDGLIALNNYDLANGLALDDVLENIKERIKKRFNEQVIKYKQLDFQGKTKEKNYARVFIESVFYTLEQNNTLATEIKEAVAKVLSQENAKIMNDELIRSIAAFFPQALKEDTQSKAFIDATIALCHDYKNNDTSLLTQLSDYDLEIFWIDTFSEYGNNVDSEMVARMLVSRLSETESFKASFQKYQETLVNKLRAAQDLVFENKLKLTGVSSKVWAFLSQKAKEINENSWENPEGVGELEMLVKDPNQIEVMSEQALSAAIYQALEDKTIKLSEGEQQTLQKEMKKIEDNFEKLAQKRLDEKIRQFKLR